MGIRAEAKNGGSCSLSYLYWSWVRHVAAEEGVVLPQSASPTDSLTEAETRQLAHALRTRAEKIRSGDAPRDATSFVQGADREWFPPSQGSGDDVMVRADFDDPDGVDETANFFETSGGVTLRY